MLAIIMAVATVVLMVGGTVSAVLGLPVWAICYLLAGSTAMAALDCGLVWGIG